MKSENMKRAYDLFNEFECMLRMAHTDAVIAQDKFAEILIFMMLEEAAKTHWELKRMWRAAQ